MDNTRQTENEEDSLLPLYDHITSIYTLGPPGTNCEKAAHTWFTGQGYQGNVHLHTTLEIAVQKMRNVPGVALLGCVVYPDLHHLVFDNLDWLVLVDCFVVPTHHMVLAAKEANQKIVSVASHPAPVGLIPSNVTERRLVTSNVQAAIDCAQGWTDACITTDVAAREQQLTLLEDFGPVMMGFTIHAQRNRVRAS